MDEQQFMDKATEQRVNATVVGIGVTLKMGRPIKGLKSRKPWWSALLTKHPAKAQTAGIPKPAESVGLMGGVEPKSKNRKGQLAAVSLAVLSVVGASAAIQTRNIGADFAQLASLFGSSSSAEPTKLATPSAPLRIAESLAMPVEDGAAELTSASTTVAVNGVSADLQPPQGQADDAQAELSANQDKALSSPAASVVPAQVLSAASTNSAAAVPAATSLAPEKTRVPSVQAPTGGTASAANTKASDAAGTAKMNEPAASARDSAIDVPLSAAGVSDDIQAAIASKAQDAPSAKLAKPLAESKPAAITSGEAKKQSEKAAVDKPSPTVELADNGKAKPNAPKNVQEEKKPSNLEAKKAVERKKPAAVEEQKKQADPPKQKTSATAKPSKRDDDEFVGFALPIREVYANGRAVAPVAKSSTPAQTAVAPEKLAKPIDVRAGTGKPVAAVVEVVHVERNFALVTNPATQLPMRVSVGDKLPNGATVTGFSADTSTISTSRGPIGINQ